MTTITYNTFGTCSRQILIDIDDNGTLHDVRFVGGCAGNTAGVSALVRGMKAADVIARLKGIRCGMKPTSCPDQLAQALESALTDSAAQR